MLFRAFTTAVLDLLLVIVYLFGHQLINQVEAAERQFTKNGFNYRLRHTNRDSTPSVRNR